MKSRTSVFAALALGVAVSLSGCSTVSNTASSLFSFGSKKTPIEEKSAEQIYREAEAQLLEGDEKEAAALFGEIERLYPYSEWAKRGMLMSAYSYYQASAYDQAILAAERFSDFYPADDEAPYAQYLIAQSEYERITDVGRDQKRTEGAVSALREIVQRHPESEYARDALIKLDSASDQLAGKEMEVGRYYLKRGHHAAAINRFQTVIQQYQTASHTPEALHRLVESYLALGVEDEAKSAAAVLGHNFPGSDWYQYSYALLTGAGLSPELVEGSWIQRAYKQVVKGEWL